jgi:hypothetical protein
MPGAKDDLIQRLHSLRERATNQTLAELGIVAGVEIDAAGIAQVRLRVNNPARSRKELEDDVKAAARGPRASPARPSAGRSTLPAGRSEPTIRCPRSKTSCW